MLTWDNFFLKLWINFKIHTTIIFHTFIVERSVFIFYKLQVQVQLRNKIIYARLIFTKQVIVRNELTIGHRSIVHASALFRDRQFFPWYLVILQIELTRSFSLLFYFHLPRCFPVLAQNRSIALTELVSDIGDTGHCERYEFRVADAK